MILQETYKDELSKFETVTGFEDAKIPERKTQHSAGYDIACYEDTTIQPDCVVLVKTGLKCSMPNMTHGQLHLRSSIGIKYPVCLANGVGIIDEDYYNNESNEGHIQVPIFNYGKEPITFEKGTTIAQLVIIPYAILNKDNVHNVERKGGFGSTNENIQP